MAQTHDSEPPLRFRVRAAFTISGRGTVAIGYIEQGAVRVGDRLTLLHEGACRVVTCAGVAGGVRLADWTPGEPAPIGLMLPELRPDDLTEGDVLLAADGA